MAQTTLRPRARAPARSFLPIPALYSSDRPPAVIINYSTPTAIASGVLLDIDFNEGWTIEAFDSDDVLIDTITLKSGAPGTGNAMATSWIFEHSTNDISSIRLNGIRPGGAGLFGLGFDNFETGVIPEPNTALLLGLSLSVLILRRRSHNAD